MSKQTYILTSKHHSREGLLQAGDEIDLTAEQAQALTGKVVLASAAEAAEAMGNDSADERVAELTAQVEALTAENADLKARLGESEGAGEAKQPGLVRQAVNAVTGNNSAQAQDESVREVGGQQRDASDL